MSELILALAIALTGGMGAALRYLTDRSLPARVRERYAWGTLIVNAMGSLALGLLTGASLTHPAGAVVATGLLGGYTTFSTASVESIRLLLDKRYLASLAHGPGMLIVCTALAVVGIVLTNT